jgi:hypothetical protein
MSSSIKLIRHRQLLEPKILVFLLPDGNSSAFAWWEQISAETQ